MKPKGLTQSEFVRLKYRDFESVTMPGKHKYLMPLDRKMRKQIAPLAKPYPKKTEQGGQHGKSEDATPAQHTRP